MTVTGTRHSAAVLAGPAPRSEKQARFVAPLAMGATNSTRALRVVVMGHLTTTTAFMNGCGVQWNANSPACVNVWLQVLPGSMAPESHEPSSAVMVWTRGSLLVQVIVPPTGISIRLGPKAMVFISACVALATFAAAAAPSAPFAARLPKYRLSVNGIVNSNPPRTLSMPRQAPGSVAVLVFVTCSDSVCGE